MANLQNFEIPDLEPGETVLWTGRPVPLAYAAKSLPIALWCVLFMFVLLSIMLPILSFLQIDASVLYYLLMLPVAMPFVAYRIALKTRYAITNRRLLSGTNGSMEALKFSNPGKLDFKQSRILGTGDVFFIEKKKNSLGWGKDNIFTAIRDSENAYRHASEWMRNNMPGIISTEKTAAFMAGEPTIKPPKNGYEFIKMAAQIYRDERDSLPSPVQVPQETNESDGTIKPLHAILFGLLFLGIAINAAIDINRRENVWQEKQTWQPVEATVISGKLVGGGTKLHRSPTLVVAYRYLYNGGEYSGEDSAKSGLHDKLRASLDNKTPVTAWVNPSDPARSVIDLGRREDEEVTFLKIFGIIFGALGILFLRSGMKGGKLPFDVIRR